MTRLDERKLEAVSLKIIELFKQEKLNIVEAAMALSGAARLTNELSKQEEEKIQAGGERPMLHITIRVIMEAV